MEEELLATWKTFSANYPTYVSEITTAILNIERKAHHAVEAAQPIIAASETRVAELRDLISRSMRTSPQSSELQGWFMQGLSSYCPGLESSLQELKVISANPPEDSIYADCLQFGMDDESIGSEEEDESKPKPKRGPTPPPADEAKPDSSTGEPQNPEPGPDSPGTE
jgi:hypothetical protein